MRMVSQKLCIIAFAHYLYWLQFHGEQKYDFMYFCTYIFDTFDMCTAFLLSYVSFYY